jgi:hypothetical protein
MEQASEKKTNSFCCRWYWRHLHLHAHRIELKERRKAVLAEGGGRGNEVQAKSIINEVFFTFLVHFEGF